MTGTNDEYLLHRSNRLSCVTRYHVGRVQQLSLAVLHRHDCPFELDCETARYRRWKEYQMFEHDEH
jgi:hypothetical protein